MDTEKSEYNSGVAARDGSDDGSVLAFDPKVVRRLRTKMDLIILPTLAIMYTFKSVEKSFFDHDSGSSSSTL